MNPESRTALQAKFEAIKELIYPKARKQAEPLTTYNSETDQFEIRRNGKVEIVSPFQ